MKSYFTIRLIAINLKLFFRILAVSIMIQKFVLILYEILTRYMRNKLTALCPFLARDHTFCVTAPLIYRYLYVNRLAT
jgi:hypothetical protein